MKSQVAQLMKEENALDARVQRAQTGVSQLLAQHEEHAHVAHASIRSLGSMKGETVIAVRAEQGTRLEVPDPEADHARRYQIYLKSERSIDVFLVSHMDTELVEEEERAEHVAAALEQQHPAESMLGLGLALAPSSLLNTGMASPFKSLLRAPEQPPELGGYFSASAPHEALSDIYGMPEEEQH